MHIRKCAGILLLDIYRIDMILYSDFSRFMLCGNFCRCFLTKPCCTLIFFCRNEISFCKVFFCPCNTFCVLREPLFLGYQHFINHLPDFRRVTYGSGERIHHSSLFQELYISAYSSFYSQFLYPDRLGTHCGTAKRQITDFWYADAISIHIARHFYHRFIREIGDTPFIHDIEVSPVGSACFQRFDNVRTVFFSSLGTV